MTPSSEQPVSPENLCAYAANLAESALRFAEGDAEDRAKAAILAQIAQAQATTAVAMALIQNTSGDHRRP